MPEWVRIVISASVGAIFGISGNVMMEFVKPIIQRRKAKKQIINEMLQYFAYVEVADETFNRKRDTASREEKEAMIKRCGKLFNNINPQRYNYFSSNQQSVVYEIPHFDSVQEFYSLLSKIGDPSNYDPYDAFSVQLSHAYGLGHGFLHKNAPRYKDEMDIYEAQSVVQDATEIPPAGVCG
jgi:GTP1/Obg family GTP-binding protein